MKTFLNLLKFALLLFVWCITVHSSEISDKWIELINDNGTITKVKSWEYQEYKELIESSEYKKQYLNVLYNESLSYTELPANTEIEGYKHDYKINKKPKTFPIYVFNMEINYRNTCIVFI